MHMSTQLIDLLRDWSGQLYSPMKNMLFAHEHPISKSTARLVWAALFTYEDFFFAYEHPIRRSPARLVWAAPFAYEDYAFCTCAPN